MKFKQILLLSFLVITILISLIALLNYFYLQTVRQNINIMTLGNEQEVIQTAQLSGHLTDLNMIMTKSLLANQHQQDISPNDRTALMQTLLSIQNNFLNWKQAINVEALLEAGPDNAQEEGEVKEANVIYNDFLQLKVLINQLLHLTSPDEKTQLIVEKINPLQQKLAKAISISSIAAQKEFHEESIVTSQALTHHGWINLIIAVLILVALLIINFFLTILILRNLNKITRAMKKVASGDFSARIDIKGNNEFGLLAKTFNEMTRDFANTKKSIESIVNIMPNLLFVTDANLIIQQVNDRACRELGLFREEIIGTSLEAYLEEQTILKNLRKLPDDGMLTKKANLKVKSKRIPILFASAVMKLTEPERKRLVHIAQDISQIKRMENELIATSRQAGMADVATSVLHNVGNVLNSIKTSVSLVEEKVKSSSIDDLAKVIELLEAHKSNLGNFLLDDPKGKNILKFLHAYAEVGIDKKASISAEIDLIKKYTEHISNIITTQQEMNATSGVKEDIDIAELVEDALDLNLTSMQRRAIKVIRDFKSVRPVTSDKAKLLQVIVNLLKNAFESILESEKEEKILKVVLREKDETHFIIQVQDNGLGILPENLVKIFSLGFTTKKKGHGFGLHSSALAIKEMGGTLDVFSQGLGQGATFTIIFPYNPENSSAEKQVSKERI